MSKKRDKAKMAEKDKKIKSLQGKLNNQTKEMKHQQGTLNRKAVRMALKTADLFAKK